ncbi:MAG: lytic murein transglycosylase [Candidatus Moranbacteria bacterium]|nr:lytic murein transglycosylase [Candidatus Moranbacteria bacterium]
MLEMADNKGTPQPISDLKEIEKAAEFASEKTGVRKDFLMGMLTVESDLGRNTGKCTYAEVAMEAEEAHRRGRLGAAAWRTFQERQKIIKRLAGDLGYDTDRLKVSCNPGNYAGTGGALGVPQFMPDIWMHYKDEIAEIVGKDNPDPWNAKDGVVAMALLLADTPGVTEHNYYAERNSAKMYLSGTTSGAYEWYANQAVYWSRNYAKLLG